jgi:hypothetical protein
VSGPAVTALTRGQAESATAAAAAQRDTIQANLLDLDASFGKRLLAGASLAGETRRRWATASAALTRLWETFTAYSAVVEQAVELLPRARKSAAALADIAALLTGASVQLPTATSALASRDLTRTGTAAVTLATAVGEMRRTFAGVAELVTSVERVWNELAGPVQDLADQLAAARQQARGIADVALDEAAGTAEAGLGELRGLLNADPLALVAAPGGSGGAVDTARLGRLRQQVSAAAARAAELGRLRADADTRVAAAGAAVAAARDAWQDAMAARAKAEVKIVAELPPLPVVAGLAEQAAALGELRAAGRWTRLATELDDLDSRTAEVIAQCQAAERAALALLDRRDELRGLLDAYRARAARLGAVEDSELEARYTRAQELLWTAPCDLPSATAAVTGYQQAVLALSGLGGDDERTG